MFAALRKLLTGWFGPPTETQTHAPEPENAEISRSTVTIDKIHPEITTPPLSPSGRGAGGEVEGAREVTGESHPVPYDENLLERARTQWQFGDWKSLAQIGRDTLQHHPDRAKIALLAAAGRLQTDKIDEARQYIRLAKDWGVSKTLLARILAAGVHNSLGRAAAIAGEQPRAHLHFQESIMIGTPGSEAKLITKARFAYQYDQLHIENAICSTFNSKVDEINFNNRGSTKAMNKIIWVHIGTVKTGSTAIQKYLLKNRELLIKNGFNYVDISLPNEFSERYANADFLCLSDCNNDKAKIISTLKNYKENELIISDEALWANTESLKKIECDTFQINLVIYIRNPVELIASWSAECAEPYNALLNYGTNGYGLIGVETGLGLLTSDYVKIFDKLFSEIKKNKYNSFDIRFYEKDQLTNRDVISDFINLISPILYNDKEIKDSIIRFNYNESVNLSKTRKYCDISSWVYYYLLNSERSNLFSLDLVENIYKRCKSGDERSVFATLSPNQKRDIASLTQRVKLSLLEIIPGKAHEISKIFERNFNEIKSVYIPLSDEELIDLTEEFIKCDLET